jgi:hypothetical protein
MEMDAYFSILIVILWQCCLHHPPPPSQNGADHKKQSTMLSQRSSRATPIPTAASSKPFCLTRQTTCLGVPVGMPICSGCTFYRDIEEYKRKKREEKARLLFVKSFHVQATGCGGNIYGVEDCSNKVPFINWILT